MDCRCDCWPALVKNDVMPRDSAFSFFPMRCFSVTDKDMRYHLLALFALLVLPFTAVLRYGPSLQLAARHSGRCQHQLFLFLILDTANRCLAEGLDRFGPSLAPVL